MLAELLSSIKWFASHPWAAIALAPVLIIGFRKKSKTKAPDRITQHQDELIQYLSSPKSKIELGLMYERQIGHHLEEKGYQVEFSGAVNGFDDMGIDLIARKGSEILIVQTKYWAKWKSIREKQIFQLFGSAHHYKISSKSKLNVKPIFFTSAKYSDKAKKVASDMGVDLQRVSFSKAYPMIKCNVTPKGERIYHLPTDEFYDKIKIESSKGKLYVWTVAEAEAKGFRRAIKYKGKTSA